MSREPAAVSKIEKRVFLSCLTYMLLSTAAWLWLVISQADGGVLFRHYNVTLQVLLRLCAVFVVMWIVWSYFFYRLKYSLLRRLSGFSQEDLRIVFSNRQRDFDLNKLLGKYSERKIRIIDMIGRRGRTATLVIAMFAGMYIAVTSRPDGDLLAFGIQSNYFEGILWGWWSIITFYSNNVLGRIAYGAHARIMDGHLGRANALFIGTLWNAFRFTMIPIGIQLARVFQAENYAPLLAFIWLSYIVSDTFGEIVGSLLGRQTIRVWGIGEINKKSVEGTVAVFASSLVLCALVAYGNGLGVSWYLLAIVVSCSNTVLELWSPRGTDDFTMATANALICWAFGVMSLA